MLNLIGIGLNENSLTAEALEAIESSDEVYLENYTVDFPYTIEELENSINRQIKNLPSANANESEQSKDKQTSETSLTNTKIKISSLNRGKVEDESIIEKAKDKNISLLVYGDSLSATTHTQLLLACKKANVESKIFHNASILTAIAETGLQLYKFGKTSSMPTWTDSWKPESFIEYIKQNQSIGAHSLLLIDIALPIDKAIEQLKEAMKSHEVELDKIIVCKNLGTKNSEIIYDKLENIKDIQSPFCFIIPSELQKMEKEFLDTFKK